MKIKEVKLRISLKLIIMAGGAVLLINGIFSYIIISSHQEESLSQISQIALQLSESIKSSTRFDMLQKNRKSLHQIINAIGRQEGIRKIRIFNQHGSIIFSSDEKEIGTMVNKKGEACYACHVANQPLIKVSSRNRTRIFKGDKDGSSLGIINPIYNEPSCSQASCHAHSTGQNVLGVLDIVMNMEKIDEHNQATLIKMIVFASVAIISLSLILWFSVKFMVGNPFKKLMQATQAIAKGDFDYRIELAQKDEIGTFATAFNSMTEELSQAQQKLYQSDRLASLGRLAAGVAHEINNPLTGVLGYGSYLLEIAKEKEMLEGLEIIVRETVRCRDIVKSLLGFAKQIPQKKTESSVNQTINHAIDIVKNQLSLHKIKITLDYDEKLPSLKADHNQLQQVFINLILNAIDAIGEEGGTIHITTKAKNINGTDCIEIQTEDTGCGIEKEKVNEIFDPFYTTKGVKGTGLGLAVVWGIIEEHGGKIDVKSTINKGTTIILQIPLSGKKIL